MAESLAQEVLHAFEILRYRNTLGDSCVCDQHKYKMKTPLEVRRRLRQFWAENMLECLLRTDRLRGTQSTSLASKIPGSN